METNKLSDIEFKVRVIKMHWALSENYNSIRKCQGSCSSITKDSAI